VLTYALLTLMGAIGCKSSFADEGPQPGVRYKTIRPLHLMATYNSLNHRQVSKETASAYLHSERYADTSWIAFQVEVPAGTIITILSRAPNVWHLPFFANRYFVRLDPDLSRGLDVQLVLNRGIQGSLGGLNAALFEPYVQQ
jgi:hypothetical protein